MFSLDKVTIPADSAFDLERAMELANLISIAYNEYEVWDSDENLQTKDSLPKIITGSRAFVELHANQIEKFKTQTGTIAGNHNLTETYRRALDNP